VPKILPLESSVTPAFGSPPSAPPVKSARDVMDYTHEIGNVVIRAWDFKDLFVRSQV